MFAKDVELLNELYSNKIVKEFNLGPRADSQVAPTVTQMQRIKIPSCDSGCGEDCEGLANHEDTNSGMVKQSLYRLVKLSAMLHDLIEKSDKGAEPWVLSKVTEALNHVESVYGYMDYEHFKDQVISDIEEVSEETEADLYDSISRGGKSIVSKLRSVLSTESRETIEELVYEAITALESR